MYVEIKLRGNFLEIKQMMHLTISDYSLCFALLTKYLELFVCAIGEQINRFNANNLLAILRPQCVFYFFLNTPWDNLVNYNVDIFYITKISHFPKIRNK